MKKKKGRIRPFRILSVLLGVIALFIMSRFPAKAVSLERQKQRLEAAAQAYYDEQSRNNQLTTEKAEINTADFVERTARREQDYCWYGEIIYEIANLEDIEPQMEFEIYDGE